MSNKFSVELGLKSKSNNQFDCRILGKYDELIDRVLVHAVDFQEVRWCMIGYTKEYLNLANTSLRNVKRLIIPTVSNAAGVCGEYLKEAGLSVTVVKL